MSVEIYRIGYSWKRGGVSSGDTEYFESEESFLIRLMNHELSYRLEQARRYTLMDRLVLFWRDLRGEENDRTTTNIRTVEKLVDGEWRTVLYDFVPPAIKLNGVKVIPADE